MEAMIEKQKHSGSRLSVLVIVFGVVEIYDTIHMSGGHEGKHSGIRSLNCTGMRLHLTKNRCR